MMVFDSSRLVAGLKKLSGVGRRFRILIEVSPTSDQEADPSSGSTNRMNRENTRALCCSRIMREILSSQVWSDTRKRRVGLHKWAR